MLEKIKSFFKKHWKKVVLVTVLVTLDIILFFAAVDIKSILHLIGFLATTFLTIFALKK